MTALHQVHSSPTCTTGVVQLKSPQDFLQHKVWQLEDNSSAFSSFLLFVSSSRPQFEMDFKSLIPENP